MRIMSTVSLAAVVLFSLAACALADRMSGVERARALQASGHPAEALILDIWDTGITVNDDPVIGLRVEVFPTAGSPYEAEIPKSLVSRVHIPQFQPGQRVAVRVDPHDPNEIALDVYQH